MKTRTLLILSFIILFSGGYLWIYRNIQPQPAEYKEDVLTYLDEPGAVAEKSEVPCYIVDEEGRITSVDLEAWKVYGIAPFLENSQVRRVREISELEYPLVDIGDRMRGNNEKLYYTYPHSKATVEFTLSSSDSLAFLLLLTDAGTPYQEVREFYTASAIEWIRGQISFEDEDIVTPNGSLIDVDIRTQATAEKLFSCIQNSEYIVDVTDRLYAPMHLPVKVGGTGYGDFNMFSFRVPDMNQCIEFRFTEEDSEEFYQYVRGLAQP